MAGVFEPAQWQVKTVALLWQAAKSFGVAEAASTEVAVAVAVAAVAVVAKVEIVETRPKVGMCFHAYVAGFHEIAVAVVVAKVADL